MPEAFAGAKEGIEAFEPTIERLKELWQALMPVFAVVGAVIGAIVLALVGVFVGMVTGIAMALEPFLKTIAFIVEGVAQFVQGIIEVITGLFMFIAGIVTNDMTLFEDGWDKMSEGITNIILGLVLTVVALWEGLIATIGALIGGFIDGIIAFFQTLFDVLVGNSIIPDLINAIIEWFITLAVTVIEKVSTFLITILTLFNEKSIAMMVVISLWVLKIIAKFLEMKTEVIKKITEMWAKLVEIVETKKDEIIAKFEEFVARVKTILTETDWLASGSAIVEGIIEGIKSKLADAQAAILGIANDVKSAWDNFWNSNSPSRLMIESGSDIMQGAEMGIESHSASASNTMSVIGVSMADAFNDAVRTIMPIFDNTIRTILPVFGETVGNILPNSPSQGGDKNISNVNQTTNNFNVENSFSGSPQVTDADGLRIALAGLG